MRPTAGPRRLSRELIGGGEHRATTPRLPIPRLSLMVRSLMSAEVSHEVHAAGTYRRGVLRWGYFLLLNGIAFVIAGAIFVGLLGGDVLDPYLRGTYEWLLAHPGVTSFLAFSPLSCSMLVGWGYSQRARKRKKAESERLARVSPEGQARATPPRIAPEAG
jgi:hypothetical protein